ncbi:hypothetical protein ADK67_20685 [Saccharothrix sp. NRRL B-16348]|uniref:hypothetical protein n=1 Tax=Saccharothrix sp. NRRL B-16348 TaxID=1415542 RepID=UPI0006C6F3B4|nr:hypothetical protein [Saccharothrix sp. NRRL B-16348]KOX23487.1 hypothetical protein ADK67_20685 [Saccharothrix sp. NRRL B-16348]
MVDTDRRRRRPAYALTIVFLAYAVGKAVFAAQSRLGIPGGPLVSAADTEAYALEWWVSASSATRSC